MTQQSAILRSNRSLGHGLSSHSIILLLAYFCLFGHCIVAPFKPFLNFRSTHFLISQKFSLSEPMKERPSFLQFDQRDFAVCLKHAIKA